MPVELVEVAEPIETGYTAVRHFQCGCKISYQNMKLTEGGPWETEFTWCGDHSRGVLEMIARQRETGKVNG